MCCPLVALHSQNWWLVCGLPCGLSVQSSRLFLDKHKITISWTRRAWWSVSSVGFFFLLCLSLWKPWALSSSFCYFSCRGFSFLFLGEQWSAVMPLNAQILSYKHWHKEKERQHVNNKLNCIWSFGGSFSLYQDIFWFIRHRVEERSRRIKLNNKVRELALNNAVRTWTGL